MKNVLFLCSGNSARSILAEALLTRHGEGRFKAYSAGIERRDQPNPWAMQLLEREGFDIGTFRCKTWSEFSTPYAPKMDHVIAICDKSAEEFSAGLPGTPEMEQWSITDPAAEVGDDGEMKSAFEAVYRQIEDRVRQFVAASDEDAGLNEMADTHRRLRTASN